MDSRNSITFRSRVDVDIDKWNACIEKADNGLIYAHTDYLDTMSRNWDGLVWKDYEAVMPLCHNQKYGISYLYHPFTCAQGGVFGNDLTAELINDFLEAIPEKFTYWDIYLNKENDLSTVQIHYYLRQNYTLDLDRSYEEIVRGYRENTVRNIKKAEQRNLQVSREISFGLVIDFARAQMKKFAKIPGPDFQRFDTLCHLLKKENRAEAYAVQDPEGNILSSCIFFYFRNRAYYILVGNPPEGRNTGASHFLIDRFIREHAEQNRILDFEGSDIPQLAFFYSSFGSAEEKYPCIKLNRLPWHLKWLKG